MQASAARALGAAAPCPAASRSRSSRVAAPAATPLPRRDQRQQWAGAAAASAAAVGCLPRRGAALRCRAAAAEASDIIDVEGTIIDDRVPVTVITGFLGSGKTTLLNSILSKEHGYRIAVIENEIGAIDIDSDLVSMKENLDPSKEQILMLNNGCLCCTVRDDLVEMLNQLYDRRSEFDHVLIETTGLAQPAPIIQTFFLDPKVSDRMRLDGVVTLVDAKHVELHLDDVKAEGVVNEAVEQIAYADRVILNKTDLVGGADLDRLEGRIRSINSMAQITRAQKSNVPLDYVFGVGGFDLEKVEEEVMKAEAAVLEKEKAHSHSHAHEHDHECGDANCKDESHNHSHESHSHAHASSASSSSEADCKDAECTDPSHDHSHAHSHSHEHEHGEDCKDADCTDPSHNHSHGDEAAAAAGGPVKSVAQKHDDAVGSVAISIEGDMDLDKVNYWLGGLMEVKSNDLYRMKGVLAIKDFPARFVFQGVHMLFEGMPDREWKEGEKRVSKMVFIGKDLDEELIREGFQECVVKS